MKRILGCAAGCLATVLVLGPGFAAQGPGNSFKEPPSRESTTTPAQKPGKLALSHTVTGTVVSVNKKAEMFTLKTTSGNTVLLKADADTASQLGALKSGERVKVSYKNSQGDKIATKIAPA